jgi:CHAT domain-containing protein
LRTAPLDLGAEAEVLRKALEPAIREGRVVLQMLREEEATRERLQEAMRTFTPHVFHFVGHGHYMADREKGALLLHSSTGPRVMSDDYIVTLLHEGGIQLALLNGCDTGRTSPTDAISGIASLLVLRGVPAVIATVRRVTDDAAILFSREFYRTFADGYSLEDAVTEARKALSVEQQDWMAYALYVGTTDLSGIRVPTGTWRGS